MLSLVLAFSLHTLLPFAMVVSRIFCFVGLGILRLCSMEILVTDVHHFVNLIVIPFFNVKIGSLIIWISDII